MIGMNRKSSSPGLKDVPELMHHIQSLLPVKEAARTGVLSKSWLHAWSTIPNLRFHEHMKLADVDRSLVRYLRDDIPIERFELKIDIQNQKSAALAQKWIRSVATKTSLKELSLTISPSGASLHLPEELLSGENLIKITVSASQGPKPNSIWMTTTHHPKCVTSLRELHFSCVTVSEQVLHDIFSSCSSLVKIELILCSQGLNTIKVKNLHCLRQLQIVTSDGGSTAFEISHLKSLRMLGCNVRMNGRSKRLSIPPLINGHSISLGSGVTELTLGGGMIMDDASLDMIVKLGLPFLESLTLNMACWTRASFPFTSASIKRFSLLGCTSRLVDLVYVNAPKLLLFSFSGKIMPCFVFPYSTLEQIEFRLRFDIDRLDVSFFLKMRESLRLSSKCRVHITTFSYNLPMPLVDIYDLRRKLRFPPATNVQQLLFETTGDECMWESSPFFDAFFEICHPDHVSARPDSMLKHKNHFCKLIVMEVLEKNMNKTTTTSYWPHYLKNVQIERPHNKKWETLTDSDTSFLEKLAPEHVPVQFKLNWW
ncbi:hypothetical protein LXL04_028999 [Taraxacum kok-saghyz]